MALTKNPASGAADRARKCSVVTTHSQHSASDLETQDRRAAWLARRFNLSITMAAAVAEAAFNVGGAR
jgi:hypothetical protein